MAAKDPDPFGGYYFALEVSDGGGSTEIVHFMECSGLTSTCTVSEIEEGGLNGSTHKRPGQSRWDNIVLKYATNASQSLREWRDRWLQDSFSERPRSSGSIALENNAGDVVRRWHFHNAWPVGWEGPSLHTGSSDLAIETLEVAHDGSTVSNA